MSELRPDTANHRALFPLMLKLAGRRALVAGAGSVAESKIEPLLRSGAQVRVVAPRATPRILRWAGAGAIAFDPRPFRADDLRGIFVVIVATSSPDVNHTVAALARQSNVLCNVVDDPDYCDFYFPAVVRRGDLQIAISTAGQSPAMAQQLRQQLEAQFGPEYEDLVSAIGRERRSVLAAEAPGEARKQRLHDLAAQALGRQRGSGLHLVRKREEAG
ncbi:MAG TPA: bifunctional precorrin-2 dehydrogenase/sirohydrochlorin ferrochelatase [Terriglobales bacterium]|nr:bifunctional precorrin-2 dehydrogenase/sirohydrochlorin ferrochelatase [Terriglobales bacterium]